MSLYITIHRNAYVHNTSNADVSQYIETLMFIIHQMPMFFFIQTRQQAIREQGIREGRILALIGKEFGQGYIKRKVNSTGSRKRI